MASPHHIECPSCNRTHGPPTGAKCRYTKAAKEHCAELGMREEDYMLYLSDVSEEDPKDMTGGAPSSSLIKELPADAPKRKTSMIQDTEREMKNEMLTFSKEQLTSLLQEVRSKSIQEIKQQHDKEMQEIKYQIASLSWKIDNLESSKTANHADEPESRTEASNQEDNIHKLSSNNPDISNRHKSNKKQRTACNSKVGDEGYTSFMSNTHTNAASDVPVSSTELGSPHAQGGQFAELSEHEAADTEPHISEHGAQACIRIDQGGEIFARPVAAQDMHIDGQESHLVDTTESQCGISKVITQDAHCAGDQEEVVAASIAEESTTESGMGDFCVSNVLQGLGHGEQQVQGLVIDTHVRQMDDSEPQEPKVSPTTDTEVDMTQVTLVDSQRDTINNQSEGSCPDQDSRREHCYQQGSAIPNSNNDTHYYVNGRTFEGHSEITEMDQPSQIGAGPGSSVMTSDNNDLVRQMPEMDNNAACPNEQDIVSTLYLRN